MKGIDFVVDDKRKVKAVIIDLKIWGELWEDFYDSITIESRRKEKKVPWKKVMEDLGKG